MFPNASTRSALIAGAAAAAFAAAAFAALSHEDTRFIQKAAADSLAEIELGKLAQQKAMREEVQQFAARMVEDHTNAQAELKTIAGANGVELPTAIDRKHRRLLDKLSKLSGGDFDREYMEHMVSDHKHDVREFRERAKEKDASPVKTFAANTLPTLEGHLVMAQKTNDIALAAKRSGPREVGSKR
jgi:putative membrane protein